MISNDLNIVRLEQCVALLGELSSEVVFTGGIIVAIHVDSPSIQEARPTKDVDCVIEVATNGSLHEFEQKLFAKGFQPDSDGPSCRYKNGSAILDVMPIDEKILGFSNLWYKSAIKSPLTIELPSKKIIKVFSVPYFIASKIEAFAGRGKGNLRSSSDIEDIISVIYGADSSVALILGSDPKVKQHIQEWLLSFKNSDSFEEAVYNNFPNTIIGKEMGVLTFEKVEKILQDKY